MKHFFAVIALVLTFAPAFHADAQNDAAKEPQDTVRLTYTLTESDGTKKVGVQHFVVVTQGSDFSRLNVGSKIPILTGPEVPNATPQFTYVDIGLRIQLRLRTIGAALGLDSDVNQSSVVDTDPQVHQPVIRQAELHTFSKLEFGKLLRLGSLDTPSSTRHIDVDVLAERID
jgi:hypothetical protein